MRQPAGMSRRSCIEVYRVRVFYIMIAVAVVAIAVAVAVVVGSGWHDTEGRASRDTTTAVEGSAPDCDKLPEAERAACRDKLRASSAGAPVREVKPGAAK